MNRFTTALVAGTFFALTAPAFAASPAKAHAAPLASPAAPATTSAEQTQKAEAASGTAGQEARKTLHADQAACNAKPAAEQGVCMKAAQDRYSKAKREARGAHGAITQPSSQPQPAKH